MNSNIPKRRPQADAQYTMRPILLNVTFLKKTIFTAEFQFIPYVQTITQHTRNHTGMLRKLSNEGDSTRTTHNSKNELLSGALKTSMFKY